MIEIEIKILIFQVYLLLYKANELLIIVIFN